MATRSTLMASKAFSGSLESFVCGEEAVHVESERKEVSARPAAGQEALG
jgi:hypothetical protein